MHKFRRLIAAICLVVASIGGVAATDAVAPMKATAGLATPCPRAYDHPDGLGHYRGVSYYCGSAPNDTYYRWMQAWATCWATGTTHYNGNVVYTPYTWSSVLCPAGGYVRLTSINVG